MPEANTYEYNIGIDKILFDKKLFGVYPLDNIDRDNRITGDLDDVFISPQSRHAGISDKVLEAERDKGNISLLAPFSRCRLCNL